MLDGKRVAVVIPAYNEEQLLGPTVEGVPDFVDRIFIVDDRSKDATVERARALPDPRVRVIDLSEWDPPLDPTDLSALTAARWVAECLAGFEIRGT